MKISILMPIYNVQSYIGECLASINGSLRAYDGPVLSELIMVDDASTDGSFNIVQEFSLGRSDVVLVRHDINKGTAAARDSALAAASGDYVAWVDPDDRVDVSWFSSIARTLEHDTPDVIAFDWMSFSNDGEKNWRYGKQRFGITDGHGGYVSTECYVMDLLHAIYVFAVPWQRVVRKSLYNGLKHIAPRGIVEDIVMAYDLLPRVRSVYYIGSVLYSYRDVRVGSWMNSRTVENRIEAVEYALKFMERIDAKYLPALRYLILHTMRSAIRASYKNDVNYELKATAKRYRRYHRKWLLGVWLDRYVPLKRKVFTSIFAFPFFKPIIERHM